VGQERLGPSYFFISLVLGPLEKQPLMVRTFLKVYMELGSYFLFLQEQIKDIISRPPPLHMAYDVHDRNVSHIHGFD
jgi:hypothetical protein